MTAPRISVVMPTHNRAKLLPATLRALAAQTIPPSEYEVILVADGCTDDTPVAVAGVRAELPYHLHFIEQPGQGAGAARNLGVAKATSRLILFLDDDMTAAPTLIEAHLLQHAAHPDCLVLGYFPIPLAPISHDPFARAARDWWEGGFAARRRLGYRFGFKDFCTGNISLPAELFHAAGGFDPRLKGAGEDYELGYRLLKRGARFRFAEHALSVHQDLNSLERALHRCRAEGHAHALTVNRHIELARSFNLHRLSRLQGFPFSPIWRLVWAHPAVADAAAAILKTGVVGAQRLGFESLMWRLYRGLAGHAYWRGIHAALRSVGAWERLLQDAPLEPEDPAELDIDLASDLADLETKLSKPADSARLWWNGSPIGRIRPAPGAERLSSTHVRNEVVSRFADVVRDRIGVPENWQPLLPEPRPTGMSSNFPRSPFGRTRVAQFDLRAPDHLWGLDGFDSVQLFLRNGSRPLANVRLPLRSGTRVLSAETLLAEIESRGVRRDDSVGLTEIPVQPPISVILCTRDRPHALRRCLRALTKLDYPDYEVVVVDNASVGTETAEIVSETPFRYVREERPGLDWARNCGIAESRYGIIAYVDDDAVVDSKWLAAIGAAFADPSVSAVTGLVLAAELNYPAQHIFEQYGGMGKGMYRRELNGSRMTAAEKVAAHCAGVGANMAFRRLTFERVGLFDTALDVGTPSNGAGDLDMFHRVLVSGLTIRYEPAAIIWHYHRRDPEQLRKQLYNNGRAFGVYLLKILRSRTVPRTSVIRYALFSWLGGWFAARLLKVVTKKERFPLRLVLAELWGATHALWAYGATYRADRKRRASSTLRRPSITGV